jgi:hypothetical protein
MRIIWFRKTVDYQLTLLILNQGLDAQKQRVSCLSSTIFIGYPPPSNPNKEEVSGISSVPKIPTNLGILNPAKDQLTLEPVMLATI